MSFGFSVGDIIRVTELAISVVKRYRHAPEQLRVVEKDVISLATILQGTQNVYSEELLSPLEKIGLETVTRECEDVLGKLQTKYDHYALVNSANTGPLSPQSRAAKLRDRFVFPSKEIEELQARVARYVGFLQSFQGNMTHKHILETKSTISQMQTEQEGHAIIDWLMDTDFTTQYDEYLGVREPDTGRWFLESDHFVQWLNKPGDTLFCPGSPGAGKSVMTAVVIEHLRSVASRWTQATNLAFVFCNFKRQSEQTPRSMLTSLARQLLLGKPMPDKVKETYQKHHTQSSKPSVDELMDIIIAAVDEASRAFIVVDALDECPLQDLGEFLERIIHIQSTKKLNILATSRRIPEIRALFASNIHTLDIVAHDSDLKRYLSNRIAKMSCLAQDLREKIRDEIQKLAEGVFLLARLVVESIASHKRARYILRALEEFAEGSKTDKYRKAYDDTIERIKGQSQEGMQILCWVAWAKRPLKVHELQHALAVEEGDRDIDEGNILSNNDIVSSCAGLVIVDASSSVVRLVHYTIQEYFEDSKLRLFPGVERYISRACMAYLSLDIFDSDKQDRQNWVELHEYKDQYPFFSYAIKYWGDHAAEWSSYDAFLLAFLQARTKRKVPEDDIHMPDSSMKGIHIAAFLGLTQAIEALKETGNDVLQQDSRGRTPLSWAAELGHVETVCKLLQHDLEGDKEDFDGHSPLTYASRKGHIKVVGLLVDAGHNINPVCGKYLPLLEAAGWGKAAMVDMLLARGAAIDMQDDDGRTALMEATDNDQDSVVKTLLANGADVNVKDREGKSVIFFVKSDEITRLLLTHPGIQINVKDREGVSALFVAARRGIMAVVERLLGSGINVNEANNDGWTPLMIAAYRSRARNRHRDRKGVAIVKMLLATAQVGVDARNCDGNTALSLACAAEALDFNPKVVKHLLKACSNSIDVANNLGRTPLSIAAGRGHEDGVAQLIRANADMGIADSKRQTPLFHAVRCDNPKVVELLVHHCPNSVNMADHKGKTPLHQAAKHGYEGVVTLLLQANAKVDARTRKGQTPLLYAARWNNPTVVKLLLDYNPDLVDTADYKGKTPLQKAVRNGRDRVVALLVQAKANLNAQAHGGETALRRAIREGGRIALGLEGRAKFEDYVNIVQLLLDNGAIFDGETSQHTWDALYHPPEMRRECWQERGFWAEFGSEQEWDFGLAALFA